MTDSIQPFCSIQGYIIGSIIGHCVFPSSSYSPTIFIFWPSFKITHTEETAFRKTHQLNPSTTNILSTISLNQSSKLKSHLQKIKDGLFSLKDQNPYQNMNTLIYFNFGEEGVEPTKIGWVGTICYYLCSSLLYFRAEINNRRLIQISPMFGIIA